MQLRKCKASMKERLQTLQSHVQDVSSGASDTDSPSSNISIEPHLNSVSCSPTQVMPSREIDFGLNTDAFDSLIGTEAISTMNTLPWSSLANLGDADCQQTSSEFTEDTCLENQMTAYAGLSPTTYSGTLPEAQIFAGLLQQYTAATATLNTG
jgi:hypothetical protein